jgi:methionine--tRNA ligase beta chain
MDIGKGNVMALAWFIECACDHAGVAWDAWPKLPREQQINTIQQWQTHINSNVDFVKLANFKEQIIMDENTNTANLSYEDFVKFDIRVGTVISAEPVAKSKKLLKLEVSFGMEIGCRTILAGIAGSYIPTDLIDRRVVAVLNLAPREMMGTVSNGMLLAASTMESGLVSLLTCPSNCGGDVADGTKVG